MHLSISTAFCVSVETRLHCWNMRFLLNLFNKAHSGYAVFTTIRIAVYNFTFFTVFQGHSTFFHGQMHTFSRPNLVFTAISWFQGQTVFFEAIWPNGLWPSFSRSNGPPGRRRRRRPRPRPRPRPRRRRRRRSSSSSSRSGSSSSSIVVVVVVVVVRRLYAGSYMSLQNPWDSMLTIFDNIKMLSWEGII